MSATFLDGVCYQNKLGCLEGNPNLLKMQSAAERYDVYEDLATHL